MSVCSKCGFDEYWATQTLSHIDLRRRLSELDAIISSLTSQLLSLPPEITAEIFLHCLPSGTCVEPSLSAAPLLLTQICRQWRQIALDTPGLWSSLQITNEENQEISIELVSLWLSRSGTLPLDINFHWWDESRAGSAIVAGISFASRWRDIELALPLTSFAHLDLRMVSMPNLRTLVVRQLYSLQNDAVSRTLELIPAPSLRDLKLFTFPDVKVNAPWVQLTSLTLARVDIRDGLLVLGGCTNLLHFEVSTTGNITGVTDTLILHSLVTLACHFGRSGSDSILEHLTLPRLLHLRVAAFSDTSHVTIFKDFIHRSTCSLQSLAVVAKEQMSPETLLECLRCAPASVFELELLGRDEYSKFPVGTFSTLNPDLVLPHLKTIHLRGGGSTVDGEYQSLVGMVRARRDRDPVMLERLACEFYCSEVRLNSPSVLQLAQLKALAAPSPIRPQMSLTVAIMTPATKKTEIVYEIQLSNERLQSVTN
ncbi:F-box domain-containing protein [Favolaschia claudopus]|uniref:F-box domain-containing protein n=1 Tax=Favolaschia claudopus TaxID=2862362 RepID=A0AAW0DHN9_9AGAR